MSPDHGTVARYRAGCRETCCRAAAAKYEAQRQLDRLRGIPGRYVNGIGSARRLQALAARGWSAQSLSPFMGLQTSRIHAIRNFKNPFVRRDTAARVTAVYNRLSMQLGPSNSARIRAASAGWPPPLAWDDDTMDDPKTKPAHRYHSQRPEPDEVAIHRRLRGDATVALSRTERRELVARLHALGFNDQEIAIRTGLWDRVILRDRQALGLPANADARGNIRDRRPA